MDCEIGSGDMGDRTIDAIRVIWAVDNAIRSRNASNLEASSRVHSFASVVDNAIRSRTASNLGTSSVDGFSSAVDMRIVSTRLSQVVSNETEYVAAQLFTWAELVAATNYFSLDNKIGVGISGGVVYRDKLIDGREEAIKRAENISTRKSVTKAELSFLSFFHHKHLVRLVGLCEEKKDNLVVYEYMKNGSLYDHLYHKNNVEKGCSVLNSWKMRIEIALDASRGIEYLHKNDNYDGVPTIVHGNIKSSNILLDATWTARVSGFESSFTKRDFELYYSAMEAAKTLGSIDPDCCVADSMLCREYSDEYYLGIVLVELLTGKRPILLKSRVPMVDFVVLAILAREEDMVKILDPRVGAPDVNEADAVKLVALTAFECVHLEGKYRPTITDVVLNLENALAVYDSSNDRISSVLNLVFTFKISVLD